MMPLPRKTSWLLPVLLAGLLLSAGCSGSDADAAGSPAAGEGAGNATSENERKRQIRDLITAVSPPPPDATAIAEQDWFQRRKETLELLRKGDAELGRLALQGYRDRPDSLREVRAALLDVAAHCLPEETRPVLIELITTYGDDLGLRKNAVAILGTTSPAEAIDVLEPLLVATTHAMTYPPADAILDAWLTAMTKLDRDPVMVLSDVATDPRQEDITRNLAIKALGNHDAPRSRQALETILVESGGNNMARRYAAQSLVKVLPGDELCALINRVFENEADIGFQQFLASVLEDNCR